MGDEGGLGWRAQLVPDLQGNESLTKFGNVSDLGKAYVDLEGKASTAIQVPGEKSTDEERATFYNKLGRPEKPEGYEFSRPALPNGWFWSDGMPTEPEALKKAQESGRVIPYDQESEQEFKGLLHSQGFTKAQAQSIYDHYHGKMLKSWQEVESFSKKNSEENDLQLSKLWGTKKQGNVELAHRAFDWACKGLGKEEGEKAAFFLRESGLDGNPILIRLFHLFGTKLSEDSFVSGSQSADRTLRDELGRPRLKFPSMGDK